MSQYYNSFPLVLLYNSNISSNKPIIKLLMNYFKINVIS